MTLHSSPVPFTLANDMPYSLELRVLVDTHLGAPAQLKQASKRPGKKSSQRRSSKTRMRIFRPTNSSTSRLQPPATIPSFFSLTVCPASTGITCAVRLITSSPARATEQPADGRIAVA
jgi:hypothetical protein